MRLRGLDLNLLIALDILLEEHNVSRSAERMHLSQPAASAALGRLRKYFNDELLVLHGKRMIPTSFAQNLAPEVKRILAQVDGMIATSSAFDPGTSERTFRLMGSDYVTTVLITPVVARMNSIAPNVTLDARLPSDKVRAEFEHGEVDLVLVPEEYLLSDHPAEQILEERYVALGWSRNPVFESTLTVDSFLDCAHVAVALEAERNLSFADRQLESLGYHRRIAMFAPIFSAVPRMLVGTNLLAVMPERLARTFLAMMPLTAAALPMEFAAMRVMMQFHTARSGDQGLKWLREQFHDTASAR